MSASGSAPARAVNNLGMSTQTFDEGMHPLEQASGRFATKTVDEADGGLALLATQEDPWPEFVPEELAGPGGDPCDQCGHSLSSHCEDFAGGQCAVVWGDRSCMCSLFTNGWD